MKFRPRIHYPRGWRAWLLSLVLALCAVLLLLALLLSLRPAREVLLGRVLGRLPASVTIGVAEWPQLFHWSFADIRMVEGDRVILHVERADLQIDARALRARHLELLRLELTIPYADIPAVAAAFGDADAKPTPAKETDGGVPYLRQGAILGVPSMALRAFTVTADSVHLGGGRWLSEVDGRATADLLEGHAPVISAQLQAHDSDWGLARLSIEQRPAGDLVGSFGLDALEKPLLRFGAEYAFVGEERVGLDLEGSLEIPGTQQLATIPLLAESLRSAPTLEGAQAKLEIELRTRDADWSLLRAEFQPHPQFRSLSIVARARRDEILMDEFALIMEGLNVSAEGRVAPEIDARLNAELSSLALVESLGQPVDAPQDLRMELSMLLAGTVDDLNAAGNLRGFGEGHGIALNYDAQILPDALNVKLSPIEVAAGSQAAAAGAVNKTNLWLHRHSGRLELRNVQIRGDYGPVTLSGHHERPFAGALELDWSLQQPPTILLRRVEWPDSTRARVLEAWSSGRAHALHANASYSGEVERRVDLHATLELPGPATFAALLPDSARVDDLHSLDAVLDARLWLGGELPQLDADLDLAATAWVDTAMIHVEGTPENLSISSRGALLQALYWDAVATLVDSTLAASAQWRVEGEPLLRRLDPTSAEGLILALRGDLRAHGKPNAPTLSIDYSGQLETSELRVPTLTGHFQQDSEGLELELAAPDGVLSSQLRLDRVDASIHAPREAAGLGPMDYSIDASGPELSLLQVGRFERGNPFRLETEAFRLELSGQELQQNKPVKLSMGTDPFQLRLEQLDLGGSLGTVSGSGSMSPEGGDLQVDATLRLPEKPDELIVPAYAWPEDIQLSLHALGPRHFEANLGVTGITLDGEREVAVLGSATLADSLRAHIEIRDPQSLLLEASGATPFDWEASTRRQHPLGGDFRLDLVATQLRLPAVWLEEGNTNSVLVNGQLHAGGSRLDPDATAEFRVGFPGWTRIGEWSTELKAWLVPSANMDSVATAGRELRAEWGLERAGERLLSGEARLPLVEGPSLAPDHARAISFHASSATLDLRDLDELLAADIGMDGSLGIRFSADGDMSDPSLSGRMELINAQSSLPDGSQLLASGTIDIEGRASLPELKGRLQIHRGVFIIPNPPPSLLPASGSSLLWEAQSRADSSISSIETVESGDTRRLNAAIDVSVDIPSGLWVRGKGLEMELSGNLRMLQAPGDSLPTITGELNAVRGSLSLLGHDFSLKQGAVSFFGSALTPQIDARLGTRVGETEIDVVVSGTAARPQLQLSSIPEMTEGDISSLLLFGRPLDELDDDQMGLVGSRTNEVARSFGIAALQNQLRQKIGVDLLQIGTGSADGTTSVLVGKYLRPDVLLKYEQMLQEATAFLVNLEYLLTRQIRLETTYGRKMHSGVEINWTKDY